MRAQECNAGNLSAVIVDVGARAERGDALRADAPTQEDVFVWFAVEIRERRRIVGPANAPDARRQLSFTTNVGLLVGCLLPPSGSMLTATSAIWEPCAGI